MTGAAQEVAPGAYRIELPLPWELETVNVYAIRLEEGWALLDTGVGTRECFLALEASLEGLGIAWSGIRLVVITHTHPDHSGLAARVLERTGAKLWMHAAECEQLCIYADAGRHEQWQAGALELAGVPEALRERMRKVFEGMRVSFARLEPERELCGGERIAARMGDLETIWTPGHSPGHVCLYQRESGVLFSGDQVLERITPNVSWQPGHDALGHYLDSLRMLEAMEVRRVLPSHGAPFAGHRERVGETLRHHEERCRQIRAHVTEHEMTAHEVAAKLWTRKMGALNHYFAAMESLAHLDYMERRGELRSRKAGAALVWSLAA